MRITGLFRPLSTQNEHRSPRNGARFLCFRKKGPIVAVAMRREWRAAGRDVAQVREGAETSPQRVGAAWAVCGKNAGAAREGSGVVGSGVDSLRK